MIENNYEGINIIFVDCFNTIIYRRLKKKDVFRRWAQALSEIYNIEAKKFYDTYKYINFNLCLRKFVLTGTLQENFEVVLGKMFYKLSKKYILEDFSCFIEKATNLYIEKEFECFRVNRELVEFLKREKENGKKIYLVSDFYCKSEIILKWLSSLEISEIFDNVFSSGDVNKEKATTKLYKHLLKRLNISSKKVVMLGDNIWSDVLMAKFCGLKAKKIKKNTIDQKLILNKEWDDIFYKYKENNLTNHAFPLYLFTERLYEQLIKEGYKEVFFMSREGQFLKVLFEKFCQLKKELGQSIKDIKAHYFYGSRNSIMAASVGKIEQENFDLMFRFFNYFIKPSMFLFSIGFSNNQIEKVRQSFGKSIDKMCFNFKRSKTLKKLKLNATFREIYEENRVKQSEAFSKYMAAYNGEFPKEGIAFVDIGYHGTMQDLVFKFFNGNVKMRGYFIKSRAASELNNSKIGLLGDRSNKHFIGSVLTKYDAFNYEQILRANHGRCLGYEIGEDGESRPIIDAEHKDVEIYEKYVKKLQEQILVKFELIARKALAKTIDSSKLCSLYFYYTIKNKTKSDYEWILNMQDCHHDDFGYVGYPGRAFARGIRKFVFVQKDRLFVASKKSYVKKLKKDLKENIEFRD